MGTPSDHVAILRDIAMAPRDLPIGVDGLDWADFVPATWRRNPLRALQVFRRFAPATAQAADFLASNGLVPEAPIDHGLRWMNEMRVRYP